MTKLLKCGFLCFIVALSTGFDFHDPVLFDGGESPRTDKEREASYIVYDSVKEAGKNVYRLHSTTNFGEGDIWYAFSKDMAIYKIDVSSENLVGESPLARWPHMKAADEVLAYTEELYKRGLPKPGLSAYSEGLDCLKENPLRYGLLHPGQEQVLVLTLNNDFVVVSPQYERVVFSERYKYSDWANYTSTEKYLEDMVLGETDLQYVSSSFGGKGEIRPALRSYSKIYIQSFDDDEHPDIVVWRKAYRSNLKSQAEGFSLVENDYSHFERDLAAQEASEQGVTGEYLPQETEPETIQAWLASNDLTWVDGYPSESECEGREGELIQEMHDPLLNDPEVLQ